jgi:hypothetical protein
MAALATLEEARRHLKLTTSNMADADVAADVADKLEAATEIVIDYIKQPDHEWTDSDVPYVIKAAVLLTLGELFDNRETATITDPVKNLLHRYRDPALA